MAFNPSSIARIKNLFLKGVLTIYIIAFISLYVQIQPLFGDNGIVPIRDFAQKATSSGLLQATNIIIIAPKIGLSYGTFIELLCLTGLLLAFSSLFMKRLANSLTFGLLWYVYYQICLVGQGFMSFHSDLLLLEVGFISILLAPLLPTSRASQSDHDHMSFFLIKWLVFRYFVTNVLSIYNDNDPAWYKMTAVPMVAQGVQFPSLFSWHIFNMPAEYVKLYQAYEHSVKLCAPFLMFFDLKYSRLLGFYTLLFVAIPSALFFNFGWTDLLISVCLLSLLKDSYFYTDKRAKQSGLKTFLDLVVVSSYVALIVTILTKCYGLKHVSGSIHNQVMFTNTQFKLLSDHLVPAALVTGLYGLLSSAYTTLCKHHNRTSVIKNILYASIAIVLFASSFPTLTKFSPGIDSRFKVPHALTKDLNRIASRYMLINNYILLPKVSELYANGRPELHIQVRSSVEDPAWQQVDFKYKPGHPSRELSRVLPHIPRIDLRMWYAARSSFQYNQWLKTLAYRIGTKERSILSAVTPTDVLTRVGQIRIVIHNYKYSSKAKHPFAGYWSESKFVSEYMAPSSLDQLKSDIKSQGISLFASLKDSSSKKANSLDQILNNYLELLSDYIRGVNHQTIIWTFSAIAFVSLLR